MKEIKTEKIPIKMWLEDIEEGALKQAQNLANLPMAFNHIAIMPDSHQGYGMPIGGVLATKGVIIPNAVGVDIGCGMCAIQTTLEEIDIETLKKIVKKIKERIPVGFNHQKTPEKDELLPPFNTEWTNYIINHEYPKQLSQIGTLGGGNHFIEIQKGSDGYIWIMIHSGSRNLGKQVAEHYNKIAINLNAKWHSTIPPEWELAFLPEDSQEGQAYIKEMEYCVAFALANRKLMMERIEQICEEEIPHFATQDFINIAHNYAKKEKHFGHEVWIHRKGATLATKDTIGIIPGSQGTKSYIVKGKGNIFSFTSCSHGAGRKMGRKEAERTLDLQKEIKTLEDQGILHEIKSTEQLDEAPGAYKDISTVMKNQEDLVEILVELTPLAVIKG